MMKLLRYSRREHDGVKRLVAAVRVNLKVFVGLFDASDQRPKVFVAEIFASSVMVSASSAPWFQATRAQRRRRLSQRLQWSHRQCHDVAIFDGIAVASFESLMAW